MFVCLYISARFLRVNPEWKIWFLAAGTLWWTVAFALVKRYPGGTDIWNARVIRAFLGLCVLIPMWVGFMHLKEEPHSSLLIIYVMLVVWGADTGAYFAGRKWGNKKLAPNVSPGKSWAGFWGGLASSQTLVVVIWFIWGQGHLALPAVMAIALLTSLASVLGDLLESMVKRHSGVKDSGTILPGHGGMMDRMDSITAAAPVFTLGLLLAGWQ